MKTKGWGKNARFVNGVWFTVGTKVKFEARIATGPDTYGTVSGVGRVKRVYNNSVTITRRRGGLTYELQIDITDVKGVIKRYDNHQG